MSLAKIFDHECPNILIFDEVDSTSSELKRLINSGYAEAGMIVTAEKQKSGYGKEQRHWVSESGNIHFSFLLKSDLSLTSLVKVNFLLALSIREYLIEAFKQSTEVKDFEVKWPNDLMYKGEKFGGIISESINTEDGANYLVCGVGLNVISAPASVKSSTALSYHGLDISDRLSFVVDFLCKFEQIFSNWSGSVNKHLLITELNNNLAYKKDEVYLSYDGKEYKGSVVEVDLLGQLHFKTQDGENLIVSSGDLYKFRSNSCDADNVFHLNKSDGE